MKSKTEKRRERSRAAVERREFSKAWWDTQPPTLNVLMTAKTKPRGVSDTRWRMELRRRSNPDYYATAGDRCY